MHPLTPRAPPGCPAKASQPPKPSDRRSRFRFSPMWRPARLFAIGAVFCLIALSPRRGHRRRGRARREAPGLDVGLLGGVALFGEAKVPLSALAEQRHSSDLGGSACPLPLTHDTYDGFHIGVPSGWYLSTLQGAIAVSASPSGTLGSLLYPALLTRAHRDQFLFVLYALPAAPGKQEGAPSASNWPATRRLPTASISLSSGQTHLRAERPSWSCRSGPNWRPKRPSSSPIGHRRQASPPTRAF